MSDPSDERVTTTKGAPAPGTKAGAAPEPIDPTTGQHGAYWVLTEAERAKGFVRPVRLSYVHTGARPEHPTRPLTDEEQENYSGVGYAVFEVYPESESPRTGRFWTDAELKSGCGAVTSMGEAIAETYARDPNFYGSTFCCACGSHFPVGEFCWDSGSGNEVVGS